MGTNEKLVPGELLTTPEMRRREDEMKKVNRKFRLARPSKKINEEITHV